MFLNGPSMLFLWLLNDAILCSRRVTDNGLNACPKPQARTLARTHSLNHTRTDPFGYAKAICCQRAGHVVVATQALYGAGEVAGFGGVVLRDALGCKGCP